MNSDGEQAPGNELASAESQKMQTLTVYQKGGSDQNFNSGSLSADQSAASFNIINQGVSNRAVANTGVINSDVKKPQNQ